MTEHYIITQIDEQYIISKIDKQDQFQTNICYIGNCSVPYFMRVLNLDDIFPIFTSVIYYASLCYIACCSWPPKHTCNLDHNYAKIRCNASLM